MASGKEIDVGDLIENQPLGRFQLSVIGWSWALMFVEGYDMQVLAYAAPAIIKAWHIDRSIFGPVFGAGLFGYLIGATCLTGLADRFGRKRVILAGCLIFGSLTLAAAFASSLTELLVLRALAGLGLGSSIPTVIALNAEYASSRTRATRISLLFVGYTLGGAAGGFIAAKLMPLFGWPVVFQIGGIAPIVLCGFLVFTLPESVRFLVLKQDARERIVAILQKMLPERSFAHDALFILREETQPGFPVKHLFTEGRALMTSLLWAAFVTSFLGHHFLTSWMPTVLEQGGVSLEDAVHAGALFHVGGAVGSILIGRLLDTRGTITVAMAFMFAVPLVVLIGTGGMSVMLMLSVVSFAGIFVLGGQIGINALSGTLYPTYIRSTGAGWAFGIGRFGSVLGPVLGGVLISWKLPTSIIFICAAAPLLCCAAVVFVLGARYTTRAPQPKLV
ncbi:MAG TPA: MFS transporter [Xanthobacteraceae bacterium]|jgi:AAHS family 4-hydroxybenzoate transporter-like MFS transporter|nr:MFS transporter [Xanthobacteraceae bacterium]